MYYLHIIISDFSAHMAQPQEAKESSNISSYDSYFKTVQSRKKLPHSLQEVLTSAFAKIPVASFPGVPGGKGNSNYSVNNFITG